jgi:hypothetical protein
LIVRIIRAVFGIEYLTDFIVINETEAIVFGIYDDGCAPFIVFIVKILLYELFRITRTRREKTHSGKKYKK